MRMLLASLALIGGAASSASAQTSPDPGAAVPPSIGAPPREPGGYGGRGDPPSPQMHAARQAVRAQCAADMQKLCPDAAAKSAATPPPPVEGGPPGAGRRGGMFQCVRQHASELSPGCRQALDAMRAARGPGGPPPAPAAPQG